MNQYIILNSLVSIQLIFQSEIFHQFHSLFFTSKKTICSSFHCVTILFNCLTLSAKVITCFIQFDFEWNALFITPLMQIECSGEASNTATYNCYFLHSSLTLLNTTLAKVSINSGIVFGISGR